MAGEDESVVTTPFLPTDRRGQRGAPIRTAEFGMTLTNPAPLSIPEGLPVLLRDLIHEYTGIYFDAGRLDIMLDKLSGLVSARGYRSYMEYYYLLKYEDRERLEWQKVIEVLSVQETYFWREMAQINALVKILVPRWFEQGKAPLRIWSAACATGEEPYTIAMALLEAGWGNHPIDIVASDASEAALEKARRAVYRERAFRSLPASLQQKYFTEVRDGLELVPEIRSRIRFHRANILEKREIAGLSCAPVVFCRNVFIYFSPDTIRRALYYLADGMPSGAHLFVGASESLRKLSDDFVLQEIEDAFVYVRRNRTEGQS
jgi:chemotaxis protein methyltransferase CheR